MCRLVFTAQQTTRSSSVYILMDDVVEETCTRTVHIVACNMLNFVGIITMRR